MASQDGYLRSDVDKEEVSADNDLRLRSDADKLPAAPAYVGLGKINSLLLVNIAQFNGISMSSILKVNNLEVPP